MSEMRAITAWVATCTAVFKAVCSLISHNLLSPLFVYYLPQILNVTNPKNGIQSDAHCGLCVPVNMYEEKKSKLFLINGYH